MNKMTLALPFLLTLFQIIRFSRPESSIDVGISILSSENDGNKHVLKFDVGTFTDSLPSDLSVRIYRGVHRIFESPLNDSMSEFVMDANLLKSGENLLDVTFFSSEYGTIFAQTKLRVYRGERNPSFDIDENSSELEAVDRWDVSKYLALTASLVGFSAVISVVSLKVGPLIFSWLSSGEPPAIPVFDPVAPTFPSLPEAVARTAEAVSDAAKSLPRNPSKRPFLPFAVARFILRWGPSAAVVAWGGMQGWARYLAQKAKHGLATEIVREVGNQIAQPVARITPIVIPKLWRTILVTIGTVGVKLFALARRGGGRVFHQHIGVHDLQRWF